MKIITLHCDYIKFKPLKKAIKNAEELKTKEEQLVKEPLVVLTAVEKGDNHDSVRELIEAVKKTAKDVKTNNVVIYPYAHLSSNLASPDTALEYLVEAENVLRGEGFQVTRAPFGHYKEFELKCKGHPLAELSKEFKVSNKNEGKLIEKIESYDPKNLLKEISRTKLDTSKLKDNDHRILGQKLDLFSFNETAPGQPFWHNNGLIIFNELIKLWREEHKKAGYQEILTPQVFDNKLWKVSGHWNLYNENMFLTEYEDRKFAVKPMNCPGAMLVYKTKTRSYKDLPLRLSEIGTVHRKELSGVLSGLLRVIRITQDDAHIFCTEEQLQEEIINVINLFKDILNGFGFKYSFTISIRSNEKRDKYLGDDKLWNSAENALVKALGKLKIKFNKMPGEAKFYGPSLDVVIKDSLEREWQCSTLQLDFNLPKRFELEYVGKDNKTHTPIVLHRVVFGSLERFIAILLEHLNGNLPLWLSPIQVRVINFADRNIRSAEKIEKDIKKEISNIRIDSDFRSTTINEKIRDAELMKIPYIMVIGDKEEKNKTVALRKRGHKKVYFGVKLDKFINELKEKIDERK